MLSNVINTIITRLNNTDKNDAESLHSCFWSWLLPGILGFTILETHCLICRVIALHSHRASAPSKDRHHQPQPGAIAAQTLSCGPERATGATERRYWANTFSPDAATILCELLHSIIRIKYTPPPSCAAPPPALRPDALSKLTGTHRSDRGWRVPPPGFDYWAWGTIERVRRVGGWTPVGRTGDPLGVSGRGVVI